MAVLREEEDDGGGDGNSLAPVPSPVAESMIADGAAPLPNAMVKTDVNGGSEQATVSLVGDLASVAVKKINSIKNLMEIAGLVSNLVGFFDRNKVAIQSSPAVMVEESNTLDRIEAQTLQISPTTLVDCENDHVGDRKVVTEHIGTEMVEPGLDVVSIQINPNTFTNILHSMFVSDNNTDSRLLNKPYSRNS